MDFSIYELTRGAIRSRLLFRTEARYREVIGVTGETIRDRRDDREAVRGYFDVLDRECREQCDSGLAAMMRRYVGASAAFRGELFDWQERWQLASRKKFCRWLFRQGASRGVKMSVDEELRFSPKSCDDGLFRLIYPDGVEGGRSVDVVMLLLITFGVVRPFDMGAARSRDVSIGEAERAIEAMKKLVGLLRDDTPQMGVLEKPGMYDVVAEALDRMPPEEYSPATMWDMLNQIEDACIALSSPQGSADSSVSYSGYSMPGIWVDDADGGRSRFWIFPENLLMAFCYSCRGQEWELDPMEFSFVGRKSDSGPGDMCTFITSRGNEQILARPGGTMDASETALTVYDTEWDDESGYPTSISFDPITRPAPQWMDWKEFRRLSPADERHARFLKVIGEIYGREASGRITFRNRAPFMTDMVEALVAVDHDYLYVSDRPAATRHILRPDKSVAGLYRYVAVYDGDGEATSLRDIIISPEHPLYILPRRGKTTAIMQERKRRFIEACRNTDIDSQITIYHTPNHEQGIMCFNRFSLLFALDDGGEEIISYGAVKITSRKDFFR